MGLCIISALTNADVARQVAKLRAAGDVHTKAYDVADIQGSPNQPWPRPAKASTAADAGKPRDVTTVVADYQKQLTTRAVRALSEAQRVQHVGYVGRAMTDAERHVVWTNGHVAICAAGAGTGRPMYDEWTDAGTLTPAVWRAYARVRQFRRPSPPGRPGSSHEGVRWTWGPLGPASTGLTLDAADPEVGEARESIPLSDDAMTASPAGAITLADAYLWPLRGVAWRWAWAGPPTRAAKTRSDHPIRLDAGGYTIAIMGLRV